VAYVAPQGGKYITVPVIVPEAWRRRGYGRYLLGLALRRELTEGKIYVAAPNAENEAARALAESVGARLSAYVVHFYPPEGGDTERQG
jgi:predicted GNAT family acetyltransferase